MKNILFIIIILFCTACNHSPERLGLPDEPELERLLREDPDSLASMLESRNDIFELSEEDRMDYVYWLTRAHFAGGRNLVNDTLIHQVVDYYEKKASPRVVNSYVLAAEQDQEQTFNFSDGTSMTRYDNGLPGNISENYHNFSLNYNLLDDGKYYFSATVRYSINDDERMSYFNQTNSLFPDQKSKVLQGANTYQKLPSIDLYYLHNLRNRQTLIFNIVGTYINSKLYQQYEEFKNNETIVDIISDVVGNKYSVIGEGIYEKIFDNSHRFTAGIKHTQSYTNNEYLGDVNSLTKLNQAETYLYAEYSGKIKKFSYTGGVGVSRMLIRQ